MQQLLHDFSSKSESERLESGKCLENCDVSSEMSQSGTTRSTKRVFGLVTSRDGGAHVFVRINAPSYFK